jgi:hypothetical protein
MKKTDARQDVYLTGFILDYDFNDRGAFALPQIAPYKSVKSSSYKYKYLLGKEVTQVAISDIKHEKSPPNIITYEVSEGTGAIITRALMDFVSDETIKEAPSPLRPLEDTAVFLTRNLLLQQEIRMETVRAATTRTAAGTQVWDHASATVRADIVAGQAAMLAACYRMPTHFVQGIDSWMEMITGASFVADVKYQPFFPIWKTDYKSFTAKPVLDMQPVVANVLKNTAAHGATYSLGYTTGNDAYMVHVDGSAKGYTWCIQPRLSGYTVVKERDDIIGGWWVKVQHQIDLKEVGADALREITAVTD